MRSVQISSDHAMLMTVVAGLAGSLMLYTIGRIFYTIMFGPLAAIPGPKHRAVFELPDAVRGLIGNKDKYTVTLHQKYGPVVRLGPRQVSFTTAQAWKDIYDFRPGEKQLQKDPSFYHTDPTDKLPRDILSADDFHHSIGRRLLSHAFSDSALRGQEEILNSYFELLRCKLIEQVRGSRQGEVDMTSWYNFTTFDVIGDLAFGESFHALENSDYHPWVRNFFKMAKFGGLLRFGSRYPIFGQLFKVAILALPSLREARAKHLEFVRSKVRARLAVDTDRKDFITYIQKAKDERTMSHDEIVANMALFIVAGSETTATLLSGATYYLLRHPDKLHHLQDELRTRFSSAKDMTLVAVSQLPYLQAVLHEALRVYPPVPIIFPRVTPPEGAIIDGHFIPGGTAVGVHHWSAYRSSANWADPDDFVPERWLHGDARPQRYETDQREVLRPFSTGPRNCIGKNLAMNEIRAIMARVMWQFDLELLPNGYDWSNQRVHLLGEKPALPVRLTVHDFGTPSGLFPKRTQSEIL